MILEVEEGVNQEDSTRLLSWVGFLLEECPSSRREVVVSIQGQVVTLHTALTLKRIDLQLQDHRWGQHRSPQLCLLG